MCHELLSIKMYWLLLIDIQQAAKVAGRRRHHHEQRTGTLCPSSPNDRKGPLKCPPNRNNPYLSQVVSKNDGVPLNFGSHHIIPVLGRIGGCSMAIKAPSIYPPCCPNSHPRPQNLEPQTLDSLHSTNPRGFRALEP